ncbi:hypothetical protein ON010_g9116 [Phytophthora cinnamomi]|nr:hypothetical protein ON010_g9116 [Phytophthora cinnamomi]
MNRGCRFRSKRLSGPLIHLGSGSVGRFWRRGSTLHGQTADGRPVNDTAGLGKRDGWEGGTWTHGSRQCTCSPHRICQSGLRLGNGAAGRISVATEGNRAGAVLTLGDDVYRDTIVVGSKVALAGSEVVSRGGAVTLVDAADAAVLVLTQIDLSGNLPKKHRGKSYRR